MLFITGVCFSAVALGTLPEAPEGSWKWER